MKNQYVYTIIIPHFNIPHLLRRCLRSIPDRTDIQIIVVDDNSPNSFKFKDNISELSRYNVEYYQTYESKGGGYVRNIGINHAKGKYLLFADADDFFTENLNSILDYYAEKDFDIAFFKGTSCDTDTYEITHRADHLNKYIDLYLKGIDSNASNLRYLFGEPWCKIIKRDVVTMYSIKYDETKIHNDTTFAYLVGYYAKKIIVDERLLYCVTTRAGSVSVTTSDDRILTRVKVYGRAELFFMEKKLPVIMDK
ncbi:glycosyltransferase family 2 protein [uncultured Bacteroides sp.]|uniref:glycosyltransferase family 2 protein n=1 Tax=uncultured Bacteroides sp. TaxID=162156 RepID=UPI0026266076|nr:glycosyltransferase family 2 protein [uncultured Bacteroides sp.]